jgi:FkbM family methyltransferase
VLLSLFRKAKMYQKEFINYPQVIYQSLMRKYPIRAVRRDQRVFVLPNYTQSTLALYHIPFTYHAEDKVLEFTFEGNKVRMLGTEANGDVGLVFAAEEYRQLGPKNEDVIDVGANIADSSIYFAIKGARRVIGIEPDSRLFEVAVKNVQINGLSRKVMIINAAIGPANRYSELYLNEPFGSGLCGCRKHMDERKDTFTLEFIMDRYNTGDPILKMDCEGCEFVSLLSLEKSVLRKFKRMQIEYHRNPKPIVERLKAADFEVKCIPSLFSIHSSIGYIVAKRKN